MHTFKSGPLRDLSIEEAVLRDAPSLYKIMDWAIKKDIVQLRGAVRDFNILRRKLLNAPITAKCAQSGCQRIPRSMTFPIDNEGFCHPSPYYWCEKHEPWQRSGISQKYPIHFDAIKQMKTKFEKESIFKKLKIAF